MVPDHPTYGQSDELERLDNMDDFAMFYLDFLDQMDLDGVHLIGNSLGGWPAMEIAVRSCTRIKSLTLVAAASIRIKGKPITDIFMMDPDDPVREIFVDQTFADNILNMELTEEQTDIQIRNRVATVRLGWQPRLLSELPQMVAPHHGADPCNLGRYRQDRRSGLCRGVRQGHRRLPGHHDRKGRSPAAYRTG